MTIDEAIAKYKDITNTDANCPIHCMRSCDKCVQESDQIAEWLEELKSYRAHIFSGDMTRTMLKEQYNKAIDDFATKICEILEEYQTGFNMVSMANVWHFSRELAEQLKGGIMNEMQE